MTLGIGMIVAAAIILFRFPANIWLRMVRVVSATMILWVFLMSWESSARALQIQATQSRTGEIVLGDTGGGAAMLMIGWVPALLFSLAVFGVAICLSKMRTRKQPN